MFRQLCLGISVFSYKYTKVIVSVLGLITGMALCRCSSPDLVVVETYHQVICQAVHYRQLHVLSVIVRFIYRHFFVPTCFNFHKGNQSDRSCCLACP